MAVLWTNTFNLVNISLKYFDIGSMLDELTRPKILMAGRVWIRSFAKYPNVFYKMPQVDLTLQLFHLVYFNV